MERVNGEYHDVRGAEVNFTLTSDQTFNYTTWHAPIQWKGYVADQQVSFMQINNTGSDEDDYDWTEFPIELQIAIPHIVKALSDAMSEMN